MNRDIVALATASGVASISIVKLSGDGVLGKVKSLLKEKNIKPRYAHYKKLYTLDGNLIDEVIIIYFVAPYSYTGEDVVELQCHGGSAVSSIIIAELLKLDIDLAKGGEFSKRAVLNGKMDISKAEAINSLILADNENSVKELSAQLEGEVGKFVELTRAGLLESLSISEVIIDYADDVDEFVYDKLKKSLNSVIEVLKETIYVSEHRYVLDGYSVVIVGKPNVGKSSLLNNLVSKDSAIVSDIKGTTRDLVYETIRHDGDVFKFIDTAGIHNETDDKLELIGIAKSKASIEKADIIIAMFDYSDYFSKSDREILSLVKSSGKEVIYLINKIDLKQNIELENFDGVKYHLCNTFSINKEVLNELSRVAKKLNSSSKSSQLLTSVRQINLVKDAYKEVNDASGVLEDGELELFSFHVNRALGMIGQITKPVDIGELFDNMFGSFCLGK